MKTTTLTVKNELNINNVGGFLEGLSKFDSDVQIQRGNYKVDAKSLLGLLAVISKNAEIEIISNGVDEDEVVQNLINFFEGE